MNIELTRFKIKKGKTERVNEWMKVLNENLPAVLKTLGGEKMCVEAIFREFQGEDEYLYWFSIQGEGGAPLAASKHEIDQKHAAFSKECIDVGAPGWKVDMKKEVVMIPESIQKEFEKFIS